LRTPQEKTYKGHKTGSELLNIFLTGTKLWGFWVKLVFFWRFGPHKLASW
jgi:hypothetical protein